MLSKLLWAVREGAYRSDFPSSTALKDMNNGKYVKVMKGHTV